MIPIKHILNENGVSEIFKLIVISGDYSGEYVIKKPNGWNKIDSVVGINEEHFFVETFIIGESNKLSFSQIDNPIAFELLRNVYREQGGDGQVVFKWIAKKNGVEYDLLKDNFEINFNKYSDGFDNSMQKIDVEIIKSEEQNKLFNREDITVNLFADKDLDENDITPVETFDIGYKKRAKTLSNFYSWDISQSPVGASERPDHFFCFVRSDDSEFGNNTNKYCGFLNNVFVGVTLSRINQGPFVSTDITLKSIKIEVSNMHVLFARKNDVPPTPTVHFIAIISGPGFYYTQKLKTSVAVSGTYYSEIKIENEKFDFNIENIKNIQPGQNLSFAFATDDISDKFVVVSVNTNTSIEITSNPESPLVKTKGVRLVSALNQLVKNYTSSELSVISNFIGVGGPYYNSSISTGMYLRGLPAVYLNQKIKTSFKNIFDNGSAKLLALGFDIINDKLIIEDVKYFFKDIKVYDLSDKIYLKEEFKIENDKDVVFNSLQFGSKKYSTNKKDDIRNFTTTAEFTTPIKSVKNKFDKETELIIDEFKIQELIEDKTTSTNDNDDDLVLIDMVNLTDYWDTGIFENTIHSAVGGFLELNCTATPFDTTMIEVGSIVEITEGLNAGSWTVLIIDLSKMTLNKTTGIVSGINDTPIRYKIDFLTKNRTNDGFTETQNIRTVETATNIRHNPKYHMARWFPFFGSGLRKKLNSELIKVTNYKNNSEAKMRINSTELINELPDLVTVGEDEMLGRLRNYNQTLFNGDKITISYFKVSFEEFINIYESWRYGENEDRLKSRGYLSLNTPLGIYDVYPFGNEAFTHNKEKNILTINAKIKCKRVESPDLLSVIQIDKKTVQLVWDFNNEYINPISRVQYSLDGINWVTLGDIIDLKTATIENDLFLSIITGTDVYFRVIVSTSDYYNVISNTIQVEWQFNDWTFKEIGRQENFGCGISQLELEINGTVNLDIEVNFESDPGGGNALVKDYESNATYTSFTSPYGIYYTETHNFSLSLINEKKIIFITVKNTDKDDANHVLNCNNGNINVFVSSSVELKLKETGETDFISSIITAETKKKYFKRPQM